MKGRSLWGRVEKLEDKANTDKRDLWIVSLNDDGTYSVEGETLTREQFEQWNESLPPGVTVLVLDM